MKDTVGWARRCGGSRARRFLFVLLVAATVLFALVVRPIASGLFLAAVLAGVVWPVSHFAKGWLILGLGLWSTRLTVPLCGCSTTCKLG